MVSMREPVYDHLDDRVYTVLSETDHARSRPTSYQATSKEQTRKVPRFGAMFSNLSHHPTYPVQLDPADPVPTLMDCRWRGKKTSHQTGEVFKFPDGKNLPKYVTQGVQTNYRESEAQTDPYNPEYVVQPGSSTSELLTLAAFTWGHGLPAGLAQVEIIQRARARQAWEATLPLPDDLCQLDKRKRMIGEMEAKEWAFREGEIHRLQEIHLVVRRDLLMQHGKAQEDVTQEKMDWLYCKQMKEKRTKLDKINKDYLRSLRKLEAVTFEKLKRCGIVERHVAQSSKRYACPARRDITTNRNAHKDLKIQFLDKSEGSPESELHPPVLKRQAKSKHKVNIATPHESRAERVIKKYEVKRQLIVYANTSHVPPQGDEEKELAVIWLQKLLRGRSKQHEMFTGKKKHLDLIKELRNFHALQKEEQDVQKANKDVIMTLKNLRNKHRHEVSQEKAFQAGVMGVELQYLFDTLSKELIRLQDERRIHAFILLAERERRRLEAEESGRRQIEDCSRREVDAIFRQMVQIHQETVDLYLEDIILETLEQTADQEAREEIRRMAKEVNDIAYAIEESRNNLQSEEIVSELVYSFLIPEVEKIRIKERVHQQQRRHLQAARSIIQVATGHPGARAVLE
ncbi:cilia- and flagella-associated protein 91-like [Aulostomus maculatus]